MKQPLAAIAVGIATAMASQVASAKHSEYVEEIVVHGELVKLEQHSTITASEHTATDSAKLLPSVPGANVNSNGAVTGIAQYRGLYGDRVNVHLDRSPALTGGPNAMDAPLSYMPPLLLKNIVVSRGIVSVASGQETLGGHITANLNRGEFSDADEFQLNGGLFSRYNSVSDGVNHALVSHFANQNHKVSLLASYDEGDDSEASNGDDIGGSDYRRERYDLSYAYQQGDTVAEVFVGRLDTNDTGTPALPMDISFIESDLAGLNLTTNLDGIDIKAHVAYGHVDHVMDNFSKRTPMSPMMFRQTDAVGRNLAYGIEALVPLSHGEITLGFDANEVVHDADISNPNNGMFLIENFNQSERDGYGLFVQWKGDAGDWQLESGIRYNLIEMDTDRVSASGMMGMMGMNAAMLANRFNSDDRDEQYDNIDLVFKASKPLNEHLVAHLGVARKTRAPSYQERFLWLPLPAAGGLADGRSYIGNLDLDSEVSYELNIGLAWQSQSLYFTPEIFYRDIDDYIQGTPATDMVANMVSTMMSGNPALQFNNVDARMVGLDAAWGYRINDHWRIDGVLSYVRGERTDETDDLYRVAPLNHRLTVSFQREQYGVQLESILYAKQDNVSEFNAEQKTSGYGLVNIDAYYRVSKNLELGLGIQNLLDQKHRDHLAGYNRNNNSDLLLGDRLFGTARNVFVEAKLTW